MTIIAPSGVVTFLFTDIEGSTRRWESDADAMRVALGVHDDLIRETVGAHNGWLFKHTGDGVCAAFSSPRSAVDAAVAAQLALDLPVRMGIATGEAELRGDDYFGAVLNRVARIMAAGHGGQILLDGATAELVSSVELRDLGPRRLRDIARQVNVFQVGAEGLRAEFPALKTLDATPGNLRTPTTSFVGRDAELTELETLIKAHRMVTLTGVGGVGKTRLALELAGRCAHEFPDGVFVIELAPVVDPAAVPEAVAAVLGITQQPGMTVVDSVAKALDDRLRLLVFDNCEHVIDAAADMVEAILTHSATVKILATSREGLRVANEILWPVPSLDVDSSASALFVERASAVASTVSATKDADTVAEICRRLDGIPLGIELAASRMQSMTVAEVRDRLDDRFRLLVGSRRALERHQTLRQAVQWSYDLLDGPEKDLLTRCSVFAGGFDVDGVCAMAGSDDEFAALDLLDALVRKSLLVADRSSARTRFSMLETIRQFAEEQLVADGHAHEARTAHARYFAGREADVLTLWDGPRQREVYEWFGLELSNLRTAFRWAADHGDLDTAATIAVYATFLGVWVQQPEPVGWAEEMIEPAKTVEHPRLAQLYVMAAHCFAAGRVEDAAGYADASLSAIASGHFDQVPHEFEGSVGPAYILTEQPDRWAQLCRNIIARSAGAHTFSRSSLAIAMTIAGEDAGAIADDLVADADATNNPTLRAYALIAYGFVERNAHPVAVYDAYRRGLTSAQACGNRFLESHLSVNLASLAATHGDPVDALDFVTEPIVNFYDSGSFSLMHGPLAILATFLDRLEHYEPASIISGFAVEDPLARAAFNELNTAIAHLRDVLGVQRYESLAIIGRTMSNAAMATYALDQIDQVRAELMADEQTLERRPRQ